MSFRARLSLVGAATGALALVASAAAATDWTLADSRIHDIQGSSHVSPMAGQQVSAVPGIVTAVGEKGFWMQDPQPDSDPATSEAVFVFTNAQPSVKVGDDVRVDGSVAEFRPGGKDTANLAGTQIASSAVNVASSGAALPDPTVIGTGGRVPPSQVIDDDANGDVEQGGAFEPDTDGIDFYESLEGMRVQLNNAVAVGPRTSHGEIAVVGDNGEGATVRTARGGIVLRGDDGNPERVIIDDLLAKTPAADVGDAFTAPVTGVIGYDFGNFKLLATESPQVQNKGLARESTTEPGADELAVATFNVENLDPSDPQSKFDALAKNVVENLRAPDLLNIEEIQDNNGATDDGTVAADQTVAKFTEAIKAAGGPAYEWRSVDPENNKDGGEPGGNIRVGFLYRTDRGLAFVDKPGGDATTPVDVGQDGSLTMSPGRVDPANAAFANSRKPVAGEFTWNGKRLIVVANHWNSKGGDDPLVGRNQPANRSSEEQRAGQAKSVADFVTKAGVGSGANVIVAGDLNDFDFSTAVKTLTDAGMRDLPAELPDAERYGYVFDGNSQVLDHILISPALAGEPYGYDVVHINAEFADQTSDHDPSVVKLRPKQKKKKHGHG